MPFPLSGGNSFTENRSAVANQKGMFNDVLMRAPSDAKQGGVTLSATGSKKGLKGQASVNVIYRPRTVLGSTIAPPGSTVTIKGEGFVAGTTVHVSVAIPRTDNTTVTLSKDVTADQNGAFSTSLSLPGNVSPGTYRMRLSMPSVASRR